MSIDRSHSRADSPRRRPGRPSVADCRSERSKHVSVAFLVLCGFPLAKIAEFFDISPRTIQLWTGKARRYDCPEAVALRECFRLSHNGASRSTAAET
jgi:hypothetical protein